MARRKNSRVDGQVRQSAHAGTWTGPSSCWELGGKAGSLRRGVTLEVGRLRAWVKWVGSGGAAEAGDGTPATRASVWNAVQFDRLHAGGGGGTQSNVVLVVESSIHRQFITEFAIFRRLPRVDG